MNKATFRAANALEAEIQELHRAKANAKAGIYLTGGISLSTILSDVAETIVSAVIDGINELLEKKENELKELLEDKAPESSGAITQ